MSRYRKREQGHVSGSGSRSCGCECEHCGSNFTGNCALLCWDFPFCCQRSLRGKSPMCFLADSSLRRIGEDEALSFINVLTEVSGRQQVPASGAGLSANRTEFSPAESLIPPAFGGPCRRQLLRTPGQILRNVAGCIISSDYPDDVEFFRLRGRRRSERGKERTRSFVRRARHDRNGTHDRQARLRGRLFYDERLGWPGGHYSTDNNGWERCRYAQIPAQTWAIVPTLRLA